MTPVDSTIDAWLASERVNNFRAFEYLRDHEPFAPLHVFSRLDQNHFNRGITAWADRVAAAWTDARGWASRLEAFDALHREVRLLHRSRSDERVIWFLLRGPASTAHSVASELGSMQVLHSIHIEEFIGDFADEDRLLAEAAAAAFAKQFGRDPVSSDELTPYVFPTPFRDRLFASSVQFTRDANHALVATGALVDLLARIDDLKKRRE
jgi:hypothetical protein